MEFGEKVRQAREAKGMTQQEIADRLFVTRQTVSRWECGSRYPDLLTAKCLADTLELSLDELLTAEDWKQYVEKTPIPTAGRAEKTQMILTAVLTVLSFLRLCRAGLSMALSVWSTVPLTGQEWLLLLLREVIPYGTLFGIGLFAAIRSLRTDVTPRAAGGIGALFFLWSGIRRLTVPLLTGFLSPDVLLLSAADLLASVLIWLFFARGKRRLAIPVGFFCIASVLGQAVTAAYGLYGMLRDGFVQEAMLSASDHLLLLGVSLSVTLLILCEMRILNRKRRTTETMKKGL